MTPSACIMQDARDLSPAHCEIGLSIFYLRAGYREA